MTRKITTLAAAMWIAAGCIGESFEAGGAGGEGPGGEPTAEEDAAGAGGDEFDGETGGDDPGDLRAEGNGVACSATPAPSPPGGVSALALLGAAALVARRRRTS